MTRCYRIKDTTAIRGITEAEVFEVKANYDEWKKHQFCPVAGVIGMLVCDGQIREGHVLILECMYHCLVPVLDHAVEEISESYFRDNFKIINSRLAYDPDGSRCEKARLDEMLRSLHSQIGIVESNITNDVYRQSQNSMNGDDCSRSNHKTEKDEITNSVIHSPDFEKTFEYLKEIRLKSMVSSLSYDNGWLGATIGGTIFLILALFLLPVGADGTVIGKICLWISIAFYSLLLLGIRTKKKFDLGLFKTNISSSKSSAKDVNQEAIDVLIGYNLPVDTDEKLRNSLRKAYSYIK